MRIGASGDSRMESKGFKPMELQRKLEILADAAKYDASCASSGTELRDSSHGKGLGSTAPGMGICHSYAPDGRCISLLKVLLTNACNYDCLYCVNKALPFIVLSDHRPAPHLLDGARLRERFKPKAKQLGFGF